MQTMRDMQIMSSFLHSGEGDTDRSQGHIFGGKELVLDSGVEVQEDRKVGEVNKVLHSNCTEHDDQEIQKQNSKLLMEMKETHNENRSGTDMTDT